MQVINDKNCSWINDLSYRKNINEVKNNIDCDWLIVGAGYTGLSAARKLAQLNPSQKNIFLNEVCIDCSLLKIKLQVLIK